MTLVIEVPLSLTRHRMITKHSFPVVECFLFPLFSGISEQNSTKWHQISV